MWTSAGSPATVITTGPGFPHQYQAQATAGTTIALQTTGDAAWRLLTGARYDTRQVQSSGEPALAEPLLRVRGIIV
jgi:hypothetical protein